MDEIQFYCIACGASLSARADSAGGLCDCPQCRRVTPIPGPAGTTDLPEILGVEIKFLCGGCQKKIRVDARHRGQTFDCPACGKAIKVPEWGSPRPSITDRSPGLKPHLRLSAEECEFLSAPRAQAKALLPA